MLGPPFKRTVGGRARRGTRGDMMIRKMAVGGEKDFLILRRCYKLPSREADIHSIDAPEESVAGIKLSFLIR